MTGNAQRTVRQVTLVVETTGLSEAEHKKRVFWAEGNLLQANSKMDGAFVAVVINDEASEQTRFSGSGTPTKETQELIQDLQAS